MVAALAGMTLFVSVVCQVEILASGGLQHIFLHPFLVVLPGFALDYHAQQEVAEIGIFVALAGSVAEALAHRDGGECLLVGCLLEVVDIHPVPTAEHGVPAAYGEAALVAQELLNSNIVIGLVGYVIAVECVVEYAGRAEHFVGKASYYQSH